MNKNRRRSDNTNKGSVYCRRKPVPNYYLQNNQTESCTQYKKYAHRKTYNI